MMDVTSWLGPEEWQAVRLSLRVAFWATFWSLPLGILCAYALARWEFVGKQVLNSLIHLPLIMPPVVTGYLLLILFGPLGPLGQILEAWGMGVAFRWSGAAVAAGLMGFPLMVRALRLSFEAVEPGIEQAAATLGAAPFWVFFTVTLPMALPGVLAGTILAFAKAMGEFGATITFVANIPGETQTVPSAIYAFLSVPGGEAPAIRLVIISIAIALGALMVSEYFLRRGQHRRGRG